MQKSIIRAPSPLEATHTHPGVDILAPCGSPVYPFADGYVANTIRSDKDPNFSRDRGGLGYMVIVRHNAPINGKETFSLYLHMQAPPLVGQGNPVAAGRTMLGLVGETGAADGCHTHFEIRHFGGRYLSDKGWNDPPNIYGKGDQRNTRRFLENWENPSALPIPQVSPPVAQPVAPLPPPASPAKPPAATSSTPPPAAAPPAVPPSAPSPPAAAPPAPTAPIPSVSRIAPNPVPGVDGLQPLTLTGAGFVAGSQVTLRTGSQVYVIQRDRTTIVSPTQIQIHVNLTRVAAQWSAEVTNPGGRVSNRVAFTVTGASSSPPAASPPPTICTTPSPAAAAGGGPAAGCAATERGSASGGSPAIASRCCAVTTTPNPTFSVRRVHRRQHGWAGSSHACEPYADRAGRDNPSGGDEDGGSRRTGSGRGLYLVETFGNPRDGLECCRELARSLTVLSSALRRGTNPQASF